MAESRASGAMVEDRPGRNDPPGPPDPGESIDALRSRGAQGFDPVGFGFVETLARRTASQRGAARRMLDRRLAAALAELCERFERAADEARGALARASERFPDAAAALQRSCDSGDFQEFRRLLARVEARGRSGPLAQLLAGIARPAPDGAPSGPANGADAAAEARGALESLRYFRSTWSRLSVDRQMSHAFESAPGNPGPLNSHFLVLRSLRLMRDISPEYLEQFVAYADALLWLDQASSGHGPAQRDAPGGEVARKRRSGRRSGG